MLRFLRSDRAHARIVRHLSAYLDGELPPARQRVIQEHLDKCATCRAVWTEVRQGAHLAHEVDAVPVPPDIWTAVSRSIADAQDRRRRAWVPSLALNAPAWLTGHPRSRFVLLAAAAGLVLSVVGLLPWVSDGSVSADELTSRSDRAIRQILQPGEVLYRRWLYHARVHPVVGEPFERNDEMQSWIDGSNIRRSAVSVHSADGRLVSSALEEGDAPDDLRQRIYFAPEPSNGPFRGQVVQGATKAERYEAIGRLPIEDQRRVRDYYGQGYRAPLARELQLNRRLLEGPLLSEAAVARPPQKSLESGIHRGETVYIVRSTEPVRVVSEYLPDGRPQAFVARIESTRYISRKNYLTVRQQISVTLEDGRRQESTRDLVEIRSIPVSHLQGDPFDLQAPPGTPTHHLRPEEALQALVAALRRIASNAFSLPPAAPQ